MPCPALKRLRSKGANLYVLTIGPGISMGRVTTYGTAGGHVQHEVLSVARSVEHKPMGIHGKPGKIAIIIVVEDLHFLVLPCPPVAFFPGYVQEVVFCPPPESFSRLAKILPPPGVLVISPPPFVL
jgi:hypothetical protein